MTEHKGMRFNQGKPRYDLVPPFAYSELAKVLTRGAEKYAERNWENGLGWMGVVASAQRHIQAFVEGKDFDDESGMLHLSHALTNIAFLIEFYKIYPQGDDRPSSPGKRKQPRLGLDIDEVLADWVGAWMKRHGMTKIPESWNFMRGISDRFDEMKDDDQFWLDIKPKCSPSDLPWEPVVYVTARPVRSEISEQWLDMHGFPVAPVITIPPGGSKVETLKEHGVEIYVDDRWDNFQDISQNSNIICFLMTCEHNLRFNAGYKRIYSLKDLKQ